MYLTVYSLPHPSGGRGACTQGLLDVRNPASEKPHLMHYEAVANRVVALSPTHKELDRFLLE